MVATPEIAAYLRIRSAHSPQWLDGGARLAFLSDITGIPQIWLMPATGGWPDQLTFEARAASRARLPRPTAAAWRSSRDVGGNERDRLYLAGPERALATADAIHSLGRRSRPTDRRSPTPTPSGTAPTSTSSSSTSRAAPAPRSELEGWNVVCDFTAHGILLARAHSNVSHDLFLVAATGGEPRLLTAHDGPEQYLPALLAGDGTIVCACDRGSEFQRLARLDPGGGLTFLTDDDADVEAIAVHEDRLAYVRNEDGTSRLTLDGRTVDALPTGVIGGLAFSPDGTPARAARVTRRRADRRLGGLRPRRPRDALDARWRAGRPAAAARAAVADGVGRRAHPLPALRPRRRARPSATCTAGPSRRRGRR